MHVCDSQEQEMEKQQLLFEQARLADRGAAEMVLLYISASRGKALAGYVQGSALHWQEELCRICLVLYISWRTVTV